MSAPRLIAVFHEGALHSVIGSATIFAILNIGSDDVPDTAVMTVARQQETRVLDMASTDS